MNQENLSKTDHEIRYGAYEAALIPESSDGSLYAVPPGEVARRLQELLNQLEASHQIGPIVTECDFHSETVKEGGLKTVIISYRQVKNSEEPSHMWEVIPVLEDGDSFWEMDKLIYHKQNPQRIASALIAKQNELVSRGYKIHQVIEIPDHQGEMNTISSFRTRGGTKNYLMIAYK